MDRTPTSVTATFGLIAIHAAFWLGYAILAAMGAVRGVSTEGFIRWAIAMMAAGFAAALAGTVFFLRKRDRLAFYLGCALMVLVTFLSITDQVGLVDVFTLLTSLATLGLMLKDRAWYLHKVGPV